MGCFLNIDRIAGQAIGDRMSEPILNGCFLTTHPIRTDNRGRLVAIEGGSDVPFKIERVYFLYDVGPGIERGFHAHRQLHQRLFCVSGSCIVTIDDGHERRDVPLDSPEIGLHIGPMIWREMHDFSEGAVLMVLASLHYDESDYIRDYDRFVAEAGQ